MTSLRIPSPLVFSRLRAAVHFRRAIELWKTEPHFSFSACMAAAGAPEDLPWDDIYPVDTARLVPSTNWVFRWKEAGILPCPDVVGLVELEDIAGTWPRPWTTGHAARPLVDPDSVDVTIYDYFAAVSRGAVQVAVLPRLSTAYP